MTEESPDKSSPTLVQVWQLPLLLVAVLLLVAGFFMSSPETPPPDPRAPLIEARSLITAERYEDAIEVLKGVAAAPTPLPDDELQAEWHVLYGDAVARLLRVKDWSNKENHQLVVDRYQSAQELGRELDNRQLEILADSLLELGRGEEAWALREKFGESGVEVRNRLRRRHLEVIAGQPDKAREAIEGLMSFATDKGVGREHRIWAIARQAEILLRDRDPVGAEFLLQRWMPQFGYGEPGVNDIGELLVLLGKAYLANGNHRSAERQYLEAQQMLDAIDPMQGEALADLGRIRYEEDNVPDALELFNGAIEQFPNTPAYLRALVGQAECYARLGDGASALASYTLAVERVTERGADPAWVDRVAESLATQREWRLSQDEYEVALKLLEQEQRLHGAALPRALMLKIASAHERLAGRIVGGDDSSDQRERMRALDAATRAEVARHYKAAADQYDAHAQQAIDNHDVDGYSESMWRAADCYDKAGRHDLAIRAFQDYAKTREDDPRRLRVTFRLAQAHHAEAQFQLAADMYQQLVEQNPKSPEAYASLVPLARCYLAIGTDKWPRAEQVLLAVVTDHEALRPESREYREALIELGRLYYKRGEEGDYVKAIERLNEAVARYGEDELLPDLLFQLGDAYRKSVAQIDKKLEEPLPPSQRAKFRAERANRLAEAQRAFDRVIRMYEAGDTDRLSDLHKLYLRNGYFYRADCAYDLGRYDGPNGSIALYDAAVQRYSKEPAVLIALIQIVNSYCELGEYDKARTANERAKVHLERIPDEAFNDPNLPMDRDHWRRWLEWTSQLSAVSDAAADSP